MTLRLSVRHTTRYRFAKPPTYGLQQLRLTPKSHRAQRVLHWETSVEGGRKELAFDDHHRNHVDLIGFESGISELVVTSEGELEMDDTAGIVGPHLGPAPLWLYQRSTARTRAGQGCRSLVRSRSEGADLERLHALSAAVAGAVRYEVGSSESDWTAEDALVAGRGVCQDHAHIFIACARDMGFPARYVSGYLMMNDRVEQEATHAWAEAHVEGLGWVGFDVSNKISPDYRYIRVATGLDYGEAAPIIGTRFGEGGEDLHVSLTVAQQ